MAMDKREIALTVGGTLAGLVLTYMLWKHDQSTTAASQAAAIAASNAQQQQQAMQDAQFSAQAQYGSYAGGGQSYSVGSPYSGTDTTATGSTGSTPNLSSLITTILSKGQSSLSNIPANPLIPEVTVGDGSSALSGVATTASQVLGQTAPTTVTSGSSFTVQSNPSQTSTATAATYSPFGVQSNPSQTSVSVAQSSSTPISMPVQGINHNTRRVGIVA